MSFCKKVLQKIILFLVKLESSQSKENKIDEFALFGAKIDTTTTEGDRLLEIGVTIEDGSTIMIKSSFFGLKFKFIE